MTVAANDASLGSETDLRQLRHHTKNALARILAQVSADLSATDTARRVAMQVERRIRLTAQVADALFGLTRSPGPFDQRLWILCESVIELLAESDQHISLRCSVSGTVPPAQEERVLRIAHEFVGNAVKHGMHMRLLGRVRVAVTVEEQCLSLTVADDGWGCGREPAFGEGMHLARALAVVAGGSVSLERRGEETVAQLSLPAWAA